MKKSFIFLIAICALKSGIGQVSPSWIAAGHYPDASASTAYNVEVDPSGNIIVTGEKSDNTVPYENLFIIKYDANGNILWQNEFGYPNLQPWGPYDLCLDNMGNAYVALMNPATPWAIAVQKYSSANGTLLWTTEIPGASFNGQEWQVRPKYLTSDNNHIYVGGTKFQPGVSGTSMLAVKINLDGDIQWTETFKGSGIHANAKSITVDQAGNVYVAGDAGNTSIDYCVVKYGPAGNLIWNAFLDGDVYHNTDIAESVLVDNAGNVYITGYNQISPNQTDIVTVKYSQDGVFQWKQSYGNPGYVDNNAYYLKMTDDGDLLVGGYSAYENPYPGTGKDYILLKYTSSGSLVWDARYDHNNFLNDHPFDFDMGPSGDVYICGITMKSCSVYKYVTMVKVNPQGEVVWDIRVPNLYGTPWEIEVIGDDDFVVAAGAFDSIQVDDATTIRYQAAPPPVYEADILDVYFESQIAPPVFDYENRKVIATVHDTANLETLVPFITRSPHSCMYPEDEIPTSFIETVWYNITSFDETIENWWRVAVEGGHVSVDILENEPIRIFPNPAKETLWLAELNKLKGNKEIGIYDLNGWMLIEKHIPTLSEVLELDISNLTSGIYFCRITAKDLSITKKIIIQR